MLDRDAPWITIYCLLLLKILFYPPHFYACHHLNEWRWSAFQQTSLMDIRSEDPLSLPNYLNEIIEDHEKRELCLKQRRKLFLFKY